MIRGMDWYVWVREHRRRANARTSSRYYDLRHYAQLPPGARDDAQAAFMAAGERFGPAYDGGCLCSFAVEGEYRARQRHYQIAPAAGHYACELREVVDNLSIFDHATYFQRLHEKVNAVVGQPYDYVAADDEAPIRRYCDAHGLRFEVLPSWHFPGETIALAFIRVGH